MTKTDELREGSLAAETPAGAKAETRSRKRPAVGLESQDDLSYVTGQHGAKDAEKQIKTPAPRRQPHKAKDTSRGERR